MMTVSKVTVGSGTVERIDTDLFDDTIEMFKNAKNMYRQCREDIFQATDRLVRVWEGYGEEAFEKAYRQLRTRLSDEEDSLRTLAENFEAMRQSYRDWDADVAKQLMK